MNTFLRLLACFPILFFTAGCVTQGSGTKTPGSDLTGLKSFYVVKLKEDERGVEKLIVSELTARGFKATSGSAETPSDTVDAIVTYQDRWQWDMTMYMIQLDIQVRDPKNNFVLASGT